jgi:hypothetical protein
MNRLLADKRFPLALLALILGIGLLPGPAMLGVWESLTYFHTFGALSTPISFIIAPRANIGGQGYGLLEIGRPLIHQLHLPLTLTTYRVPATVFGMLSVVLFFIVARRYFGTWAALGATALLAANQLFFQVQHMMSVLVVTGTVFLFLIERLQALEVRYDRTLNWIGLAGALALVSLHYGPGRIFSAALLFVWFVRMLVVTGRVPASATIRAGIWRFAAYSFAAFLLIIAVLNPRNLLAIIRPDRFFFPANSDIAVLSAAPASPVPGGVLRTGLENLRVLVESMIGYYGDYSSRYASYFLGDFRFPLLQWVVVPLTLCGLIVCLRRFNRRTMVFSTPWGATVVLLATTALPLCASLVEFLPGGNVFTLSDHRMYFCLFPLHLLVAAGLQWLAATFSSRPARLGLGVVVVGLATLLISENVREHSRFNRQVYGADWRRTTREGIDYWDDGMTNADRRGPFFASHFQQQSQYAIAGKEIADSLRANPAPAGTRTIVYADVNRFSESAISPAQLDYIAHRNFHSAFLALYAGAAGAQVNPVIMVSSSRATVSNLGQGYAGPPREFSAELDTVGGKLRYRPSQALVAALVKISGDANADVLATTPEEEAGARAILNSHHVPFRVLVVKTQ